MLRNPQFRFGKPRFDFSEGIVELFPPYHWGINWKGKPLLSRRRENALLSGFLFHSSEKFSSPGAFSYAQKQLLSMVSKF